MQRTAEPPRFACGSLPLIAQSLGEPTFTMRTPSRFMPKYAPRPRTAIQRVASAVLSGGFLLGLGYALYQKPFLSGLALLCLVAASLIGRRQHGERLRRLAYARPRDSICSFRAAFDVRTVDPWVIRAVYEAVQEYLRSSYPDFPVHPEDRLETDLLIDGDDLAFDIAEQISQRTGRSLKHPIALAWNKPVLTTGDLVHFFNRIPNAPTLQRTKSAAPPNQRMQRTA